MATNSILNNTKKLLGLAEDFDVFDLDIILFINTAFSTLNQLGLGPTSGFSISDDLPVWSDFIGDDQKMNMVQTYVYLRVRLLFDPPGTSYLISAMEKMVSEFEWRLNVNREGDSWIDPTPPPPEEA